MTEHAPRRLTRPARWALVLAGALLGTVIAPTGFWLRYWFRGGPGGGRLPIPHLPEGWAAGRLLEDGAPLLVFLGIAFLATLVLMPALVRWLERRAHQPRRAFYGRAAVAGVALGAGATALTAAGLFLVVLAMGAVTSPEGTDPLRAAMLAAGGFIFAPVVGVTVVALFVPSLVALGVPFGLLFGLLVRPLARAGA